MCQNVHVEPTDLSINSFPETGAYTNRWKHSFCCISKDNVDTVTLMYCITHLSFSVCGTIALIAYSWFFGRVGCLDSLEDAHLNLTFHTDFRKYLTSVVIYYFIIACTR